MVLAAGLFAAAVPGIAQTEPIIHPRPYHILTRQSPTDFTHLPERGEMVVRTNYFPVRYDLDTGVVRAQYVGLEPQNEFYVISSDKQRVCYPSSEIIYVFDFESGELLRSIDPGEYINSIHPVPGTHHVLVILHTDQPRIWRLELYDADSGFRLRNYGHHETPHNMGSRHWFLAFTPDGLHYAFRIGEELLLVSVETGEPVMLFSSDWRQGSADTNRQLFYPTISPDGTTLAAVYNNSEGQNSNGRREIVMWDMKTGENIPNYLNHPKKLSGITWGADSRTIYSMTAEGANDDDIWRWDLDNPTSPELIHTSVLGDFSGFSSDGSLFAASGSGFIDYHSTTTGEVLYDDIVHNNMSLASEWGDQDDTYYMLTGLWTLMRRDVRTGRLLSTDFPQGYSATFSPDGERFAISNHVAVVAYRTSDFLPAAEYTLLPSSAELTGNYQLHYHPTLDGHVFYTNENRFYLLDLINHTIVREYNHAREHIRGFDMTPDGSRVAVASEAGVEVYDTEESAPIWEFDWAQTPALDVAFAPSGTHVFATYESVTVRMWNLETGVMEHSWQPEGIEWWAHIVSVDITPDYRWMLLGMSSGRAIVYDLDSGETRFSYHGTRDEATSYIIPFKKVRMSPSGRTVYAHTFAGDLLLTFPGPATFEVDGGSGMLIR